MTLKKTKASRLAFIDWTRGLAAVIMIQGHTFDSFTAADQRHGGPFMLSQFLGGMPPAIFLFLTGITYSFLMDSQERQEPSGWKRIVGALKRSRYLFMLAFLFRLQLFVTGYPTSPASELLRVDILNCMGLAMLVLAPMAVFTTRERIRLCTILGLVICGLAPFVSLMDTSAIPALAKAYFFPNLTSFGFFPWASYLAFGMAAGSVIRITKQEEMPRLMLGLLAIGLGLVIGARYGADLPYSIYPKTEFWLNSPALTLIKLGVVLATLSVAYLWVNAGLENAEVERVPAIGNNIAPRLLGAYRTGVRTLAGRVERELRRGRSVAAHRRFAGADGWVVAAADSLPGTGFDFQTDGAATAQPRFRRLNQNALAGFARLVVSDS